MLIFFEKVEIMLYYAFLKKNREIMLKIMRAYGSPP